jgi:CubicO group peptidase (beta-lactamase class C family)
MKHKVKKSAAAIIGRAVVPFVVAALAVSQAAAGEFKLDAAMKKRIDVAAQRLVDEHKTPGIAVGVMVNGEIVYAKGFGFANLETRTKVTPDSVFRIGSITKSFTGTAILLLAEQGKLSLDDRLSKYFPEFTRGNEVTLRHLLTHTSGIQSKYPMPTEASELDTTAKVAAFIQSHVEYQFDPGTSNAYSNPAFQLLGAIIEKASGMSLADFMKQNIFDRAGMTATAMDLDTDVVLNRASGYARESETFVHPGQAYLVFAGGAGRMRSTIVDILKWQDALLAGRLVSAAGVQTLRTNQQPGPARPGGRGYSFGFGVGEDNGHRYITHNGGIQGFSSDFKAYPDDGVAFVALSNMSPMRPQPGQRPGASPAAEMTKLIAEMVVGPLAEPGRGRQ